MKNKVLLLLLVTVLVGCGENEKKNEDSSTSIAATKESTSVASTSSTVTSESTTESGRKADMSQYNQIVGNYATFLEDTNVQRADINSMAFLATQYFYTGVFHTTLDVDNNGTQELLIALGNQEGAYTLLDMYTISSDNELIRLTTEENQLNAIGERMRLIPLQDGTLYYIGSSGANSQSYKIYEFNQQGIQLYSTRESTNVEGESIEIGESVDLSILKWQSVKTDAPEQQGTSGEVDIAAVQKGDYSSISHSWVNEAGDMISIAGASINLSSGDIVELSTGGLQVENEVLLGSVSFGMTGARIAIAPKGIEFTETLVLGSTDITRDRIIIGQGASEIKDVYYPLQ
ncbi:hypothetical protein FA707_07915 [Vagococcus zengguangii]|uniref:Lipoprotein n=1 Tax=Vagococcus zengguangii TaxID=2571750 RepID=A0A4D7CWZ7_9ENTE|nr:hypothetical protein [Vagococcus zengguangii]QCI86897.1 hypothetical protein FA707_07915 [Vagococcus zengguangii]